MFEKETIAAISTGITNSGIGIVRMSGKDAINILEKIFVPHKDIEVNKIESHTVYYGNITDDGHIIDEVLVVVMRAPNTYTREDIVEIDCHGGVFVMKKILDTVLKYGARIAEPGEFTKRAFLNGRIDLSQAEAVSDIINSKSSLALDASISQLRGNVKDAVKKLREKIIYHIAYIEAALDDPEHMSLENYSEELAVDVDIVINEIEKLIRTSENGKMISQGIKTVILGKPNAGKSSLMNALLGEDRAIVTSIAGTTRDTLEESLRLSELSLNIIDTAGIRQTDDIVEKIGVNKAKDIAKDADLVIYVVDASVPLDENDKDIIKIISDKKYIVLLNKTDLECIVKSEDIEKETGVIPVMISAKNNTGLDEFEKKVRDMFYDGKIELNDELYITNLRHKEALSESLESLKLVKESIDNDMPEDFFSIDLMNAYEVLGRIIGESVEDDLVNEIFSKFCMGK
ncbi:MAG: tRNA uridine-5-carboxymethylaminomethyl(34) synthesis GTPase MnmE [Lachnospiraceae bacterium]|nr:tRNA uridine-5-carboxymethylaminomethyl(34) synthesis GTPase MnmE [Lachnospiraceae bacterium]